MNGVGANTARLILSAMDPATASLAISSGDVDAMKRVKGIGAKTAQRIIVDLQDKVGAADASTPSASGTSAAAHNTIKVDALGALTSLGFDKAKCNKVLDKLFGIPRKFGHAGRSNQSRFARTLTPTDD